MGLGLGLGFLKHHSFLKENKNDRPRIPATPPFYRHPLSCLPYRRDDLGTRLNKIHFVMHQSIPAAPSPSHPGLLWDICPPCESGGWGICNFCAARGPGICQARGQPRAFEEKYKDNNVTMLPWIRRSRGKNLLLAILIYTLQISIRFPALFKASLLFAFKMRCCH